MTVIEIFSEENKLFLFLCGLKENGLSEYLPDNTTFRARELSFLPFSVVVVSVVVVVG